MSGNLYKRVLSWGAHCKYRSMIVLVLTGSTLLALTFLSVDWSRARESQGVIERNGYDQGNKTETFRIITGDGIVDEEREITVGERQYAAGEMQEVFQRAVNKLEIIALGDNKSFDSVRTDMTLVTRVPGEPIEVAWESDRYDIMNANGEIQQEEVKEAKDGILINLQATLRYTEDPGQEAVHQLAIKVYPPKQKKAEQMLEHIEHKIQEENDRNKEKEIVNLPNKVNNTLITYRRPMDFRGMVVLLMGALVSVLLLCLKAQNEKQDVEKKRKQMLLDYPIIVNKLNLLLGAGMTVKSAWIRIAEDYGKQQREKEVRYAYEEMQVTCHEMRGGVSEQECYERFGRRCNLKEYMKLGALLSQNIKKGTKNLTALLRLESVSAFEERKSLAKKMGEEAATKLLLPMFFMLGIVLVIVIVPAFLSIQI